MRYAGLFPLFVASVLFSSCSLLDPGSGGAPSVVEVTIDRRSYPIDDTTSIRVTFTNRSSDTLYYSRSFQKTLEELQEGKVVNKLKLPVKTCECPTWLVPHGQRTFGIGTGWIREEGDELQLAEGRQYQFRLGITFNRNDVILGEPSDPVQEGPYLTSRFRFEP